MLPLLRRLRHSPLFCIAALVTLALGVGVNTTAFSVLNRVLFATLPYREPGRLVQIFNTTLPQGWESMRHAPGDYLEERRSATSFEGIALYTRGATRSLSEPGQSPLRVGAIGVTANFFPVLGVQPRLGRLFTEQEWELNAPLALISTAFWQSHYGSDPAILGRTVILEGKQHTIIGVMPPALDDPLLFEAPPGFWVLDATNVNANLHGNGWYTSLARLKPGVTLKQAQAEMTLIAERLARAFPATNKNHGLTVEMFPTARIDGYSVQLTWMVSALSFMVLLIACVNLANLQLVRTTARSGEFAIRLAVGCSRWQLVRLLLAESVLIGVTGGLLGLLVARWMNAYVERYFQQYMFEFHLPLDLRVIGFTILLSTLAGILFGTFPAWVAAGTDTQAELKAGGRGASSGAGRRWFRQTLVVVEIALALTLLVGAGFFVAGVYSVTHRDLGWSCDNGLYGWLVLDHEHYGEHRDQRSLAFGEHLIESLKAVPGVEAVSLGMSTPAAFANGTAYRLEGDPEPQPGLAKFATLFDGSPDFVRLYGLRLLDGRAFTDRDKLGAPPVVLITAKMAGKLWPHGSAVGRRIGLIDENNKTEWSEVVGVLSDFHSPVDFYNPYDDGARIVRPWAQNSFRWLGFAIRTGPKAEGMKETIRRELAVLAPEVAPSQYSTFKESLAQAVSLFHLIQQLLVQFSIIGLVLATGGLYGVVATLVGERRREIGIRMALGAQPRALIWLFLRSGVAVTLVGLTIGVVCSVFLLQTIRRLTYTVFPVPTVQLIVVVSAVLLVASLFASWLPAARTTKVNPMEALRAD